MGELTRFPWEPPTTTDLVDSLRRDFAYAVANTCVAVHSNNPAFTFAANTQRGQIVPRGEVKFTDGTTVELQDVGMPQPGVPFMTVQEIMSRIWELAGELNLGITYLTP